MVYMVPPKQGAHPLLHMQGASAHCTDNGGTVFVASSGPSLAQATKPKSELLLWTISNTSTLSDPVSICTHLPSCSLMMWPGMVPFR